MAFNLDSILGNFGGNSGYQGNTPDFQAATLAGPGTDLEKYGAIVSQLSSAGAAGNAGGNGMLGSIGDWMGGDKAKGAGGILGGLGNLWQIWQDWQQMGMTEDFLNFNKDMAQANYANTAKAYNTQLADRQQARRAFDPETYNNPNYIPQNSLPTTV